MKTTHLKHVGLTMAGIFLAGLVMNAMRQNDIVSRAIAGYDA